MILGIPFILGFWNRNVISKILILDGQFNLKSCIVSLSDSHSDQNY